MVTETMERHMWEAFMKTGDPNDYIKYSEYKKSISDKKTCNAKEPIGGKDNGNAAEMICRSDTVG